MPVVSKHIQTHSISVPQRYDSKDHDVWEGHLVIFQTLYPLVNVYITNWKITIFHGKNHSFYGHVPVRKLLIYQAGYIPIAGLLDFWWLTAWTLRHGSSSFLTLQLWKGRSAPWRRVNPRLELSSLVPGRVNVYKKRTGKIHPFYSWINPLFLWLITNITMHNHHFEWEDQLFL